MSSSTENIEFYLNIVKTTSALAATGFAIFGVIGETRDKQGKLTHWGRKALWGIIISLIFTLTTQLFENKREAETDKAEAIKDKKNDKIVFENIKRLDKIFNQTQKSNQALERSNYKQQEAINNLKKTLEILQISQIEQKKLTDKTEEINNDLRKSVLKQKVLLLKQNRILGEQQQTHYDVNRMLHPMGEMAMRISLQRNITKSDSLFLYEIRRRVDSLTNTFSSSYYMRNLENSFSTVAIGTHVKYSKGAISAIRLYSSSPEILFPKSGPAALGGYELNHLNLDLVFVKNRDQDYMPFAHTEDMAIMHKRYKKIFVIGRNSKYDFDIQNASSTWYSIRSTDNSLIGKGLPDPTIIKLKENKESNQIDNDKYSEMDFLVDYEKRTVEQTMITNVTFLQKGVSDFSSMVDLVGSTVEIRLSRASLSEATEIKGISNLELYFDKDYSQRITINPNRLERFGQVLWIYKFRREDFKY